MIGDKLIITKKDIHRAQFILPKVLKLKDKSIITIGGGSGTKKSELAQCLQEELYKSRKKSLLLSLDDYYKSHYNDRNRLRKRNGIVSIGLNEIDWKYVKKILKSFKKNKDSLLLQIINKYTDSYNERIVYGVDKINYIIIEGLYANYLKKFRLGNFNIYLEGNPEQTLPFRKRRKKEKENSEFRNKIVQKEYKIVSQLRRHADYIISFK